MGPGVRREHEERVLAALRDHGARSRAELGDLVGLSRSSLSEITTSLLDRGVIVVLDKDSPPRRGAGRRSGGQRASPAPKDLTVRGGPGCPANPAARRNNASNGT